MAIKLDAATAGAVFYSRARTKMGNTTLSTLSEWKVLVVEAWDPEKGYAVCSWNGNRPERYYAHNLKSLYDWSLYDENEAEVTRGMWDSIIKVKRRKKCTKCKCRHASAECPDAVDDSIRSILKEPS